MLREVILVFLLTGMTGMIEARRRRRQRPIAHLSASLNASNIYPEHTEITDFEVDAPFRGFTYDNGRLIAQKEGTYFIYAQVFFDNDREAPFYHNRVSLSAKGAILGYLQSGLGGKADRGSVHTSGLVELYAGDYISLWSIFRSNVTMKAGHTFFGAYKVSNIPRA